MYRVLYVYCGQGEAQHSSSRKGLYFKISFQQTLYDGILLYVEVNTLYFFLVILSAKKKSVPFSLFFFFFSK